MKYSVYNVSFIKSNCAYLSY